MPWVPAAIAGGASILGGFLGSRGAQKAAKLQYQSTVDARHAMDVAAGNYIPQMGWEADRQSWQVGDAARDAQGTVRSALNEGRTGIEGGLRTANDYLSPYQQIGTDATRTLADMMKPGGDLNRDFTFEDMQKYDPGYQFRIDQANKALAVSAAAKGGSMGGGALRALDRQTQGLASSEYGAAFDRFRAQSNDRFSRFNTMANMGYTAANQMGANEMGAWGHIADNALSGGQSIGQFMVQPAEFNANLVYGSRRDMANAGLDTARTVADLYTQGGNAMAGGKVGTANAWAGALGGVGNAALMYMNSMNNNPLGNEGYVRGPIR